MIQVRGESGVYVNCLEAKALLVGGSKGLEGVGLGPGDEGRGRHNVGLHLQEGRVLLRSDGIRAKETVDHADQNSSGDVSKRQGRSNVVAVRAVVGQMLLVDAHPGLNGVGQELGLGLGLGLGVLSAEVLAKDGVGGTVSG